jgi:hypothetical protein
LPVWQPFSAQNLWQTSLHPRAPLQEMLGTLLLQKSAVQVLLVPLLLLAAIC